MKQGWTYKKLGEVCDFRSGFAFKSSKFTKSGEPIIRISDIQNEEIDESNLVYFDPKSYKEDLSKFLIYPDDILIAMSGGTTGKLGLNTSNRKFYLNQRVGVFRENKKYLDHRFLFYFLHTKSEESLRIAAGAAQPNLSTAQINSFLIPLAPLSEQQRIVKRLDSAFAHIDELKANAEKQVNEARALFQKALSKAMEPKEGWEEKKIRDVFKIVGGGTPSKSKSTYYNGNIPWATVRDMNCDYLNKTEYSISEEGLHNSSSNLIDKGEIIIATRVGLGKVCILSQATAINQDLKAIVPKGNNINRNFVYYFFKDKAKYIEDNGVGATVKGVKLKFIEELDFPLVSPSEQQRIVSRLDSLSKNVKALEENQRKVIAECDALKQALLRKVFE